MNANGPQGESTDVIISGGGLFGVLAALRLAQAEGSRKILIVERGEVLGGNHTWSCHDSDLEGSPWIRPFISRSWPNHEVKFPGFTRILASPYHSIRSEDLRKKISDYPGISVLLRTEALSSNQSSVTLKGGTQLQASLVLDANGPLENDSGSGGGYQKFIGWDLEFEQPHGFVRPCLMDATGDQSDGYHFFYYLPWTDRTCLVEDTYYHDHPDLDEALVAERIRAELSTRGLKVKNLLRVEKGILPIPGRISGFTPSKAGSGAVRIGVKAGFFHATTGYSLPFAAQVADLIAQGFHQGPEHLRQLLATYHRQIERRNGFYCLLNRMLFRAAEGRERYRVLQRFYQLPEPLIGRFYGAKTTVLDQFRILMGRPPVPVRKAFRVLWNES